MFRYKNYVYEVYKERSISKAAANLYISQPSLSARIIKVEEELGMPIFDRSTSPLRLTEFGKIYIKAIEDVRAIEKSVEGFVNDMNTLHAGELSVGSSNIYAAYTLPPIIAKFKEKYPDIKITLIDGNSDMIESLLSANKVDMVIGNGSYDSALYDREIYSEETILLAVPKAFTGCESVLKYALDEECIRTKGYKSADCPAVQLSAFKDIPFIMLKPNNDTRVRGDKMCREAGFRPKIALEVHQQATAYMIATTNMGATFISDTLVHKMPSFENMAYYKIDSAISDRDIYFYFKKNKYKTRVMQEFMRFISNEAAQGDEK
ncbi:MAG: LysR family transcriptional regulator [Clostridia bacterium]|nr:LysR family transcriptional regulator [Clostridia bacterium]